MDNTKIDIIISDLLTVMPLFQKKLLKPSFESDNFHKVNHSQFAVMLMIKEFKICPISEISKKLFISMPNMTKILNKLIDENMIVREHDKNDRRIVNVSLTQKGNTYLDEHFEITKQSIIEKLSNLSDDQIDDFSNALISIKNVLNDIKVTE